jgi:hypothetical protein
MTARSYEINIKELKLYVKTCLYSSNNKSVHVVLLEIFEQLIPDTLTTLTLRSVTKSCSDVAQS